MLGGRFCGSGPNQWIQMEVSEGWEDLLMAVLER
jgi:hypothetical protein